MINDLPFYVPAVFVPTVFLTVGILFYALRRRNLLLTTPGKITVAAIFLWMLVTATLAVSGFYQYTAAVPPRVFLFGALPPLLLIIFLFIFFRQNFLAEIPLETLTLLHVIRIPVEIVLYWLAHFGWVSPLMTFAGWNFDILSGISAPVIYWLVFRRGQINRPLLISWNVAALILLITIVSIAVLAFPSPLQKLSPEQPNRAVMYFPYIWLPALVVPAVLFAHVVSLWKLLAGKTD